MLKSKETTSVQIAPRIASIAKDDWDRCAGTSNPFVSHAFLSILEESGCVGEKAGWLPQHLAIEDEDGRLVAAAPLYLKSHSYGEYVFDWTWADAYERAGGNYYPKLQSSIPFTPVTGPRLLVRPDANAQEFRLLLAAAMIELSRQFNLSSIHITFCTQSEQRDLERTGFLPRKGMQYHWLNQNYRSFEDFLEGLTSRKRKAIKKERRKVGEAGIRMDRLTGADIKPHHWDLFHEFYISTSERKWGVPYLTQDFWRLLGERLGEKVVLVTASYEGNVVGAALNLAGED
ncbi:MAG: GNAT family N-acetyltransferase, partial [Kiloniellales bacterium]|nr:GNAT family N-acetyltransferase [Kiloniellales bacterium]